MAKAMVVMSGGNRMGVTPDPPHFAKRIPPAGSGDGGSRTNFAEQNEQFGGAAQSQNFSPNKPNNSDRCGRGYPLANEGSNGRARKSSGSRQICNSTAQVIHVDKDMVGIP